MKDTLERTGEERAGQVQTINHCMESQTAGLSVCAYVRSYGDINLLMHCEDSPFFFRTISPQNQGEMGGKQVGRSSAKILTFLNINNPLAGG